MFFRFFSFITFMIVIIFAGCEKEKENWGISGGRHTAEIKTSSPSYKEFSYEKYEEDWEKHDTFMEKGRERSAYDVVKKIIEKAQEENNAPQLVKALIVSLSFKKKLEDKNFPELIEYIESFTEKADFPAKSVLLSYLAQMYRTYYIRNYHKIADREVLEGKIPEKIDEWGMTNLYNKAEETFFASLKNPELKYIKADVFDEILESGTMPRIFRPSLFDILAYRVLDFLMGNDPHFYGFGEQREPPVSKMLFSLPENFVFTDFSNITEDKNYLYTLELFKKLIMYHLKTGNEPAIVYANLRRLSFVRKTSGVNDAENLYAVGLERMKKNYNKNRESLSLILYHMADYQYSRGEKWHAGADDSLRMGYRKAADICEDVLENYSETPGEKKCRQILGQIRKKTLSILAEPSVCPEKPSLVKVSYRNLNEIHFKVFKVPEKWRRSLNRHSSKSLKLLKKMLEKTPVESWEAELPNDDDMQRHSTEFIIPAMNSGKYLLAASSSPDFNAENDDFFHLLFTVNRMTFSQRDIKKGVVEITVSDSGSGHFLPGVSVSVLSRKYNRKTESFSENEIIRGKTDKQGSILIKTPDRRYRNLLLRLKKDGEIFESDFRSRRAFSKRDKIFTRFFTDRSIYRPGQTVRFKAVHFSRGINKEPRLLKNRRRTVTFYGSNRKKIDEKTFQTNEFGSFSGEFKLPDNMMTAYALISDSHGSVNIAVEEYKRPEFSVSMSPVKKAYLPGSEIPVEGTVKTFSGVPVSAASVSYTVEQTVAPFMYNWKYRKNKGSFRNFIRSRKKMITHGEVLSEKNGKFNFSFTSEPIELPEEDFPIIHRYIVKVKVTDSRGETRKTEKIIRVGKKSMRLIPIMPDNIQRNIPFELSVRAENLNGEVVSASGELEIYRIERNDVMLKKRLWEMPDRKFISEDEFSKLFPKMRYNYPEKQYKTGEKIFSADYNTERKNTLLNIVPDESWPAGDYIAVLTAEDINGKIIKGKKLFVLYDPEVEKMGVKRDFAVFLPRETVKPGETAKIITGSRLDNVEVKFTIDHGAVNKPQTRILSLDRNKKIIDIEIGESHRGGVVYSWIMCRNNRCENGRGRISVPWDNKKLDIKMESFREILKPGTEETWKLFISSPKGKKQEAEFLATLFDSSLETYREHNWSILPHVDYISNIYWRQRHRIVVRSGGSWNIASRARPVTVDTFRIFDPAIFIPVNNKRDYGVYPVIFSGPDIIGGDTGVTASIASDSVSDKKRTVVPSGESEGEGDSFSDKSISREKKEDTEFSEEDFRKDFAETVLFTTDKRTDSEGKISVSFKIPDRLTRWKMYGMAHTSDFKIGQIEKELVTRKELMIKPNIPRFLRSGDKINFVTDILNITGEKMPVKVSLDFINPINGKSVNESFITDKSESSFTMDVSDKTTVNWEVSVPDFPGAVEWRISAEGKKHKDAVKSLLPVLSNKIKILDTTPVFFKEKETKTIGIPVSEENYSNIKDISFEYTSNPSWHVVFALPEIGKKQRESIPEFMRRVYVNEVGRHIMKKNPHMKKILSTVSEKELPLSQLDRNEELRDILLKNTPWFIESRDEMKNIKSLRRFFDSERMKKESEKLVEKLEKALNSDGGWPWFEGMPSSPYLTGRILINAGRLKNMGSTFALHRSVLKKAVDFEDELMKKTYKKLKEKGNPGISVRAFHYLYMRSYYKNYPLTSENKKSFDYWKNHIKKYWKDGGPYLKSISAAAFYRYGDKKTARDIIRSLKETAVISEEKGMYWNVSGHRWSELPVETHAAAMEAFRMISNDDEVVNNIKRWILRKKRFSKWATSQATVDVCHAFLTSAPAWTESTEMPDVTMSGKAVDFKDHVPGLGYIKKTWSAESISEKNKDFSVKNNAENPAWGAVYVRSMRKLDSVKSHETLISLKRQFFSINYENKKRVLKPIENKSLNPGQPVSVRLTIKNSEAMDFVTVDSMRPAGFEAFDLRSSSHYQDGLYYYRSIKDEGSHFFFSHLPRGTHIIEYEIVAAVSGNFSSGFASVQSALAPEFSARTNTVRITVE